MASRLGREEDRCRRSLSRFALQQNLPAVRLDDLLDDGESEAGSRRFGREIGIEDPGEVLLPDADAGIGDRDPDQSGRPAGQARRGGFPPLPWPRWRSGRGSGTPGSSGRRRGGSPRSPAERSVSMPIPFSRAWPSTIFRAWRITVWSEVGTQRHRQRPGEFEKLT